MPVNEVGYGWSKCFLLVRANPDEEPITAAMSITKSGMSWEFGSRLGTRPTVERDLPVRILHSAHREKAGTKPRATGRTCIHVERAAPSPVPVQTRMPRLYSDDVCETPANWTGSVSAVIILIIGTGNYLQLSCPQVGRWVVDEAACKVALHTADQVVVLCMNTLPSILSAP